MAILQYYKLANWTAMGPWALMNHGGFSVPILDDRLLINHFRWPVVIRQIRLQ